MQIWFERAFVQNTWRRKVLLEIEGTNVTRLECDVDRPATESARSDGIAIPGVINVHSHAFQRAFAGLSEYRTAEADSFWTWRKLMYTFLETLTPDDVYAIARSLYAEMLAAGYTGVGEFHYLHHQPGGLPYKEISAMADSMILAATDVGMNICMLPVYYQRAGFDDAPLKGGQERFGCSEDQFCQLVEQIKLKWGDHPRVRLGMAVHSLRAVSVPAMQSALRAVEGILPGCPIHIHVAEQLSEVEQCLVATGKRPVELLLDSVELGPRWCLIHATHLTEQECRAIADSGAVIGVCPTTEANLGDGVFMSEEFLRQGGTLAIGSDSHVTVDPRSELRLLEYAQRLTKHRRAVLCTEEKSTGRLLYETALCGGAQATGFGRGQIGAGQPAQVVSLDPDHPSIGQNEDDRIFDSMIFNECGSPVQRVITGDGSP